MSRPTNLTRTVLNIRQGNARVPCVISAPQARSATEAFESVMRMMRAPRRSVCEPGDIILDRGEYYTLAFFNITERDKVFRMFHTPIKGQLIRRNQTQHPVSGMPMSDGTYVADEEVYFNLESRNGTVSMAKFEGATYRLITSTEISIGDFVDRYQIYAVRYDNGIYYCEARDTAKQ